MTQRIVYDCSPRDYIRLLPLLYIVEALLFANNTHRFLGQLKFALFYRPPMLPHYRDGYVSGHCI